MRDPNRIDPMIEELREFWHKFPDWRLTQVVTNAAKRTKWSDSDVFYLEDDKWLEGLREMAEYYE